MHHAPALSLSLPPDRGWLRGVQGLGTLVGITTLVWLGWHVTQFGFPTTPMLATSALSFILMLWLWRRDRAVPRVQHLAWHPLDGHWSLQTQATPPRLGQLDCLADTGHWMLLRHRGPGLRPAVAATLAPRPRRTLARLALRRVHAGCLGPAITITHADAFPIE